MSANYSLIQIESHLYRRQGDGPQLANEAPNPDRSRPHASMPAHGQMSPLKPARRIAGRPTAIRIAIPVSTGS